jgi:hypothetical protein
VPIVFARRRDNAGGVLISPGATEARFENDTSNNVTAFYLLPLKRRADGFDTGAGCNSSVHVAVVRLRKRITDEQVRGSLVILLLTVMDSINQKLATSAARLACILIFQR